MTQTDFLPYGRQSIDEDDIAAVVEALRADMLTTGPRVASFENAFAEKVGARHAVVCSNGTAALHMAVMALGVGPGDVCIVPSMTFVATANSVRFEGGEVVFADVDAGTGLLTPDTLAEALNRAGGLPVKAVFPVHLSGRAVDLAGIGAIAEPMEIRVVEDACHAIGTRVESGGLSTAVGACSQSSMACFSFHPVKTIASGEGGMVTTNDDDLASRLRFARAHGLNRDPNKFQRRDAGFDGEAVNAWYYEQVSLGYNYRLPDVLCALGESQLTKLDRFSQRRAALAALYDARLAGMSPLVRCIPTPPWCDPTLHLYVVLIDFAALGRSRHQVMEGLRARGVGSQVHYIPVHQQPYYVDRYGEQQLPGAQAYYDRCLSLPLYPGMADSDVDRVVEALGAVLELG